MTGLFATLILCDICDHGVDHHNAAGCTHDPCECFVTRNGVIEAAIALEVRENSMRFRRPDSARDASGF
jgi:hypothetical protein